MNKNKQTEDTRHDAIDFLVILVLHSGMVAFLQTVVKTPLCRCVITRTIEKSIALFLVSSVFCSLLFLFYCHSLFIIIFIIRAKAAAAAVSSSSSSSKQQ